MRPPGIAPTALPRMLAGTSGYGPASLAEHRAVHGPVQAPPDLIRACERAGLRGRGGALFPTAVKLRAVAAGRGRKFVVVNGAEGEPMSLKDRVLLERAPHLVLDGAVAAADAVGAEAIVVAVPHARVHARAAVAGAIAEREDGTRMSVAGVPDAFLSGEETALIQALEGRAPRPTLTPPRPAQRGLKGRPTLVQNAETLAQLALIARHGWAWFRGLGPESHPGSTLISLGGCVHGAGVHEIALGMELGELLDASGGYTEPVRAVLIGGYHGTWVDAADAATLRLEDDDMAAAGLRMGAGVVVALPQSACPVAEVSAVMTWLAGETAGQCGPCVHGLEAIAGQLAALREGRAGVDTLRRLHRWGAQVTGRGACHHPDGSARFLFSALEVFEPDLELHRRFGACEGCDRAGILETPSRRMLAA
ncbi:MAG: NADH-ubiquinone oxidoreductase-F iron-sulfur binding region domain-containing protein [Solirubrobacteraceae bacterium]